MKLIRVASSDQLTGLFSNEFSEAITLPPHSKIALLNGMFAIDTKSIFVPADTTISFSPKGDVDAVTATLPAGYYTQTSLTSTLTQAMNYALPQSVMHPQCFAWNVVIKANFLSLNFAKSDSVPFVLPNKQATLTEAGGTFTAAGIAGAVPAGQFPAFGYSNVTVLPFNTELNLTPADNDNQFIFGLLRTKPDSSKSFLVDSEFIYGIRNDGSDLHYIVNGVVVHSVTTSVEDPENTGSSIIFNKGSVNFDAFNYNQSIPFALDGYHLALGLRATGASVADTKFNQNPFDSNTIQNGAITRSKFPLPQTIHLDESLTLGSLQPRLVTVKMSDSMQVVLGYADDPDPLKAISGSFIAQQQLMASNTPTSITVELPNLGGAIESYDGISQKRRPIVAVIPAMLQSNGTLTYEPPFPPFIDLNNRFPIQLSRLEVRLLSSFDDSEVNLEQPGCSLSFLLDHKSTQKATD